jgi:hypothetical protein
MEEERWEVGREWARGFVEMEGTKKDTVKSSPQKFPPLLPRFLASFLIFFFWGLQ